MENRKIWKPMSSAKKDGSIYIAKFRDDLHPTYTQNSFNGTKNFASKIVVVRHPGLADDGFDIGWNIALPVGHGGFPDEWFEGYIELSYLDEKSFNSYDLVQHLEEQRDFSLETFGPGERLDGVLKHIEKEIIEVREKPKDLSEWIDIILLAFDGALRQGFKPFEIVKALFEKLQKNKKRKWPDWRKFSENDPIGHIKEEKE